MSEHERTSDARSKKRASSARPTRARRSCRAAARRARHHRRAVARGRGASHTMIINMGPQHPSTHGVLRLMMELDGETSCASSRSIGYLHTGMEKTGEELTYVQGGTNVTRMDYASPLSQRARVLAWRSSGCSTSRCPPRAMWVRMMLVELSRMASHLLFQATNGMDIGAVSMMLYGWREREEVLRLLEMITGLRMNHNFIRPGWHRRRPARRLAATRCSTLCDIVEAGIAEYDELLTGEPDLARAHGRRRRHHHRAGARARRHRARSCARPGSRGTCARRSRTSRTTRSTSTSSTPRTATASTATASASTRSASRSRSCASASSGCRRGDYRVQDKKVTPPPRARIDESMEALIHHFKLFTEGFRCPRARPTSRSSRRAARSAATS